MDNLLVSCVCRGEEFLFEYFKSVIKYEKFWVRVVNIYCLFYLEIYFVVLNMFIIEFVYFFEFIIFFVEFFVIVGDFNIYVDDVNDLEVVIFLNFLELINLK